MKTIQYRSGYKYQLAEEYEIPLTVFPSRNISTSFICFDQDGVLTIGEGYAWDGPSGPTIDTHDFMRGSLVHDALYQLIRLKHLPEDPWRLWADEVLRDICLDDGMPSLRAQMVFNAVRTFGSPAADPKHERPVYIAP